LDYAPVTVTLSETQKGLARDRGLDRYRYQLGRPASDRVLTQRPSARRDVLAAGAELAVSAYLGLPWTGRDYRAHADVGERIQVRCSKWGLRIYWQDPHEHDFVWASPVRGATYELVGWLPGVELWEVAWAVEGRLRDDTFGRLLNDRGKLIPVRAGDPRLR
jgi:hypothetical protein